MGYTWEFNKDAESWSYGDYDTEEECVKDAKENYNMKAGDKIAIGTICPYEVQADIENMLEQIECDAYEDCGEVAEGWGITSRERFGKEMDELQEKVTDLVKEYIKKIDEEPSFYRVVDIHTVTIN